MPVAEAEPISLVTLRVKPQARSSSRMPRCSRRIRGSAPPGSVSRARREATDPAEGRGVRILRSAARIVFSTDRDDACGRSEAEVSGDAPREAAGAVFIAYATMFAADQRIRTPLAGWRPRAPPLASTDALPQNALDRRATTGGTCLGNCSCSCAIVRHRPARGVRIRGR